jgi:hypothetical protein
MKNRNDYRIDHPMISDDLGRRFQPRPNPPSKLDRDRYNFFLDRCLGETDDLNFNRPSVGKGNRIRPRQIDRNWLSPRPGVGDGVIILDADIDWNSNRCSPMNLEDRGLPESWVINIFIDLKLTGRISGNTKTIDQ